MATSIILCDDLHYSMPHAHDNNIIIDAGGSVLLFYAQHGDHRTAG